MKTTREILVGARQLLLKEGWIQGAFRKNGARCAWAAIRHAADDFDDDDDAVNLAARDAAHRAAGRINIGFYGTITGWNDAGGRTKEEIIAGFDDAIEKQEP